MNFLNDHERTQLVEKLDELKMPKNIQEHFLNWDKAEVDAKTAAQVSTCLHFTDKYLKEEDETLKNVFKTFVKASIAIVDTYVEACERQGLTDGDLPALVHTLTEGRDTLRQSQTLH